MIFTGGLVRDVGAPSVASRTNARPEEARTAAASGECRIGNGNLAEGITGLGELCSARLDPEIAIPARADVFVSGNGYGVLLD